MPIWAWAAATCAPPSAPTSSSSRSPAGPGAPSAPGRVLLQTYMPEHPVMQALVSGDRASFYEREADERHEHGMPPFGRLAALIVSGEEETHGRCASPARLGRTAPRSETVQVLGPAPAPLRPAARPPPPPAAAEGAPSGVGAAADRRMAVAGRGAGERQGAGGYRSLQLPIGVLRACVRCVLNAKYAPCWNSRPDLRQDFRRCMDGPRNADQDHLGKEGEGWRRKTISCATRRRKLTP